MQSCDLPFDEMDWNPGSTLIGDRISFWRTAVNDIY
jgi:hypothetical protein